MNVYDLLKKFSFYRDLAVFFQPLLDKQCAMRAERGRSQNADEEAGGSWTKLGPVLVEFGFYSKQEKDVTWFIF